MQNAANEMPNQQTVMLTIPRPSPDFPNDFPNVFVNVLTPVTRSILRIWDGRELVETFFHHANRFFPKKIVFAGAVYEPTGHESHDYQLAKA